jgi:hypothetical protein
MIVLAIIALVMGFLIGPRVLRGLSKSETDAAKAEAKQLAYQAYTEYKTNTKKGCPKVDELIEYTDKSKNEDPWGNPYIGLCKDKMAGKGKHDYGVYSWGPNETDDAGGGDDIVSWDDDKKSE